MSENRMQSIHSELRRSLDLETGSGHEALTLAWADACEKQQVISLAAIEARQTMNLRTMPGAKLVVLRRPQGGFAGWAGVDADSDPERPELFSQYVYPRYRGHGFGALLEHVWWAYLDRRGCATAYMRLERDSNNELFERRCASGYYRQATREELGRKFLRACRNCELFGNPCRRQVFLAVDVKMALAANIRARGPLDIDALPIQILR
jgi:ribosomal protein S18 acetylase RimI-like enzyme